MAKSIISIKMLFFIPNDASWLPSSKIVFSSDVNREWKFPFTKQDEQKIRKIVKYIMANNTHFSSVFKTERITISSKVFFRRQWVFILKWVMWSLFKIELILQLFLINGNYCFQGYKTRLCIIASIAKLINRNQNWYMTVIKINCKVNDTVVSVICGRCDQS